MNNLETPYSTHQQRETTLIFDLLICISTDLITAKKINQTSLVAQTVKNLPEMQETGVRSLGQEDPLQRKWLPTPVFWPGEFHGQRRGRLQSMGS